MGAAIMADWKDDKDRDRIREEDKVFNILMTLG